MKRCEEKLRYGTPAAAKADLAEDDRVYDDVGLVASQPRPFAAGVG